VVLSDGANHDASGITLHKLLVTLKADEDPQRPVQVITIAYGPEADAHAMQQISAVTHGSAFASVDPNELPQVFLAALGQRVCHPNCGPPASERGHRPK
jgi:hypothetical protein